VVRNANLRKATPLGVKNAQREPKDHFPGCARMANVLGV
jgi:hypothetical protein